MARKTLEDALERLQKIRADLGSADSLASLRQVLAGKSSHEAAKAAEICGENEIAELAPDLVVAFERFSADPVKKDPGCAAKTAIADALYRMGAAETAVYLKGIRHVQMEPVYGGKVDTATELRGVCALALVRVHHPDYLDELAELLADREAPARRMAARALAYSENPGAVPLLRLKARIGDEDAQVLTECLLALLAIAPAASLDFVARFLDDGRGEVAEAAALALGGARVEGALPILSAWWERTFDRELRQSALLAIAMLKRDDAIDFLLSIVADGAALHARGAIQALAVYRHDPKLRARVAAAVEGRGEAPLERAFDAAFDGGSG
jgi:HEAT repeat protein